MLLEKGLRYSMIKIIQSGSFKLFLIIVSVFLLEQRITDHKVEYAVYRAREIDECRIRAWENYNMDWDETCLTNNRLPSCTMETTQSKPLNDRLSKEYDRCYEQF